MIHKWWHKFIRSRTKPIPEDVAITWKRRLSYAYGFFAWNAFGLVLYNIYQGKADWAHYYGLKSDEEKAVSPGMIRNSHFCSVYILGILFHFIHNEGTYCLPIA